MSSVSLAKGQMIGPYRIDSILGGGGYATVWSATRGQGGPEMALKILRPELLDERSNGPTAVDRFLAEAELLQRLSHPGMVRVLDVVDQHERGIVAIALERLRGENLLELSRKNTISADDLLEALAQVARTLGHLHDHGVIHRDVKQSNIFICDRASSEAGRPYARLLDFGIAKQVEEGGSLGETRRGEIVGTTHALPPEVLDRAVGRPVVLTGAVDQWGLGVVLYKCLTGRYPFHSDDYPTLLEQIRKWPPPVMSLKPHFGLKRAPGALDNIIRRTLAKRPDDRYSTAHRLSERLLMARAELNGTTYAPEGDEGPTTFIWRGPTRPLDMRALPAHGTQSAFARASDGDTIVDPARDT